MKHKLFEIKTVESSLEEINYVSVPDTSVCIYENNKQEILLVRQFRPIFSDFFLELPGGSKELGETNEEAAKREFKEETGYTANHLSLITSVVLSIGSSTEQAHLFKVEADNVKINPPEPGIELVWISKNKINQMIKEKLIVDAKTIIGLQLIL